MTICERFLPGIVCLAGCAGTAAAAVSATSGTVAIETTPHAAPADGVIYVFNEQRGVPGSGKRGNRG